MDTPESLNFLLNFIARNRPLVILMVIAGLSTISLISGTEASIIRSGLTRVISLAAYPILKSQSAISGSARYLYGLFLDYDAAIEEAADMKKEVAKRKVTLTENWELQAENARLRAQLNFVESRPDLSLQAARVIENFKGALTIDQGRFHGIERSMAVITENGVVGTIIEVNDFSSIVATLHHMECKIGAMVHRNRVRAYDGVIHASGSDWGHICTMEYIDTKNDVLPGELVVTSPESMFPPGFPIGRISRVYQTGSLWKTAEVAPAVDPYRLDEVYVVRRATLGVQTLAGHVRQMPTGGAAPEQPDTRTIQEKLAP